MTFSRVWLTLLKVFTRKIPSWNTCSHCKFIIQTRTSWYHVMFDLCMQAMNSTNLTSWILCFFHNCRNLSRRPSLQTSVLWYKTPVNWEVGTYQYVPLINSIISYWEMTQFLNSLMYMYAPSKFTLMGWLKILWRNYTFANHPLFSQDPYALYTACFILWCIHAILWKLM